MSSPGRRNGFSLIELLVTMVIFSIIIVASSVSFVRLLKDAKTQGKIEATNIEGMMGLEVMRRDLTHAGYGLYAQLEPKSMPSPTPFFTEISGDTNGEALNDDAAHSPNGLPRAVVFGPGSGLNDSDRIAVKAINVAANTQCEHWTYLYSSPVVTVKTWSPNTENIGATDYVVVVRPDQSYRYLLFTADASQHFYAQYQNVTTAFLPDSTGLVFSLGMTTPPRVPFNRADFYIDNTNVPARCAPGTGVLYKSVMDNKSGSTGFLTPIPLLDCVADMQVAYRYASDGSSYADMDADVSGTSPVPPDSDSVRLIRNIRVYLLVQEGQWDADYAYPNVDVRVGETGAHIFGRDFNLKDHVGTGWEHYRWKLYSLIIDPIVLLE